MAESKDLESLDSTRLALSRPLIVFGKALHKVFEVRDSINCLDSESVGLDSVNVLDSMWIGSVIALDSESKSLNLDYNFSLDSEFASKIPPLACQKF